MQKRILIIGAGATGSLCADGLRKTFPLSNIVVWDKARGSGGRMTTTRSSLGNRADLGAQYITATTSDINEYQDQYSALLDKGVLTPLSGRVEGMKSFPDDVKHFIAPAGMGSVVKFFLAQSAATVEFNRQVSSIHLNEKQLEVKTQDGHKDSFDIVISTMPIHQFLALKVNIPLADSLMNVEYSTRFVLIFYYDRIVTPPTDWVAKYIQNSDTFRYVTWDNFKRNQSDENSSVVFHTSVDYGLANKSRTKSEVEGELVEKARALFPDWPLPNEIKCHKWLFSQVLNPASGNEKDCHSVNEAPTFLLAGDAFTTSTFNGCIRSALGAVQKITKTQL